MQTLPFCFIKPSEQSKQNGKKLCHFNFLPMAIVNETLQLPDKVCHRRSHLYFFFRMKKPTEMERSYFERAVSSQNCLRYTWFKGRDNNRNVFGVSYIHNWLGWFTRLASTKKLQKYIAINFYVHLLFFYIWGRIRGVSEVVRGTFKTRCAHYYCEIYCMQYNKFLIFIVLCIFSS